MILAQSRQTNKVNFNEMRWSKGATETEFTNWLNSELICPNKIITADGQNPYLMTEGCGCIKENPDGTISNEQIRAINNVIAITKDSGTLLRSQ